MAKKSNIFKNETEVLNEMHRQFNTAIIRKQMFNYSMLTIRYERFNIEDPTDNAFFIRFRFEENGDVFPLSKFVESGDDFVKICNDLGIDITLDGMGEPYLSVGSRYYDDPAEIDWIIPFRVIKWDLLDALADAKILEKEADKVAKAKSRKKAAERKARKEAEERELYEKLKEKFEGKK
ncbi:predicted ORF [Xanthomonas phage XacN1]|nr:predicted ORF [Xanthomonas phage XacN1]